MAGRGIRLVQTRAIEAPDITHTCDQVATR